jgi:4-amino-4-deoxy-L-arabinose transferase-like glycosyltransferase
MSETPGLKMKLWIQYALISSICFFSFFVHITADEVDVMEARNFVSAREMVQDGSWLLPTMNGELRIAKPPLPTWITAVARIWGGNVDDLRVMRLPAALVASLMVFAVFGFIKTIQKDPGLPFITTTIFAVNVLVIVLGRRNSWDIYAIFFMMIAIWALWQGWAEKNNAVWLFAGAGIAAGLSFLSKGPVAFYSFLLPFLIAYVAVFGFTPIWEKKSGLALFIAIAVIISVAWPLYVYLKSPELSLVVGKEEVSAWDYDWARPFYYYLNFPMFTGVWIILFMAYFIRPFAKPRVEPFFNYYFPLIWFAAILVLISIIPSKKERYLMPAAVPMSMMAGFLIRSVASALSENRLLKGDRLLINLHAGLLCFIALFIPAAFYFLNKGAGYGIITGIGISSLFFLTAAMIALAAKKRRIKALFMATNIIVCLALLFLWPGISIKDHKNSQYKSIRKIRNIESVKGLDFYSPAPLNIESIWDIGKKVKPWHYQKESIPQNEQFVLLFTDRESASQFVREYGDKIRLTIIDEYKWDPTNPKRLIVAALVAS